MPYRLTLQQNLPNREPSRFQVRYTYTDGGSQTWFVDIAQGADRDRAVIVVNAPVDLINQQNVLTRTLIAHYPTTPNTVEIAISSVQPSQLATLTMEELMTDYSVAINMSQDTVDKLSENNFILYAFKAVKTTAKGMPLVWFKSNKFGLETNVSWSQEYQAYTSTSEIIPNGKIEASNSYSISLNQTLNVTGKTGTGSVDTTTGTPGAIAILNKTTNPLTCGISQKNNGSATPMCAFPLFGNMLDVIAPIEQVLLMFSTLPVNTGTVIEQSYSTGIFLDLTGESSRTVKFEINTGWSWDGGAPWAKIIPANSNLVPLMIQSSPALAKRQLVALHQG